MSQYKKPNLIKMLAACDSFSASNPNGGLVSCRLDATAQTIFCKIAALVSLLELCH
jgi:hypothetical protein